MKAELSVIIVNYNGRKYLKDCFDSLYENLKGIAFEIIVVDNASADNSCTFIKQNYPDIVLVESPENLGFGKGNNLGVKKAAGDYLLLINNDTIVLDHLGGALNAVKQNTAIGAAGIKMLNAKKEYLVSVGKFPGPANLLRIKNMFNLGAEFATGNFSKPVYDVDWVTGSFLLMPKKVYESVNGFDEDYFMYVEDVDLCKRVADKGYRRIFLPEYSYIHYVGHNTSKNHLIIKGCELYVAKHFSGFKKTLSLAAIIINKAVKKLKGTI